MIKPRSWPALLYWSIVWNDYVSDNNSWWEANVLPRRYPGSKNVVLMAYYIETLGKKRNEKNFRKNQAQIKAFNFTANSKIPNSSYFNTEKQMVHDLSCDKQNNHRMIYITWKREKTLKGKLFLQKKICWRTWYLDTCESLVARRVYTEGLSYNILL